jgi:virulence factor Mce-like protein
MPDESLATVTKRRLLGLLYLVVVAALIALSIAIYLKKFTSTAVVTLKTDYTGNQLLLQSDVKERGIIVGSVTSIEPDSTDCSQTTVTCVKVKLALEPSRLKLIPSNVSAQILPKTLFGEQYVALTIPAKKGPPIKAGDTINQDRSKGALETETVLGDTLPLLQAVQPAQLNATLTAMAQALSGRGKQLGNTLVELDDYLKQMNSDASPGTTYTDKLVADLDQLGKVSTEYNGVLPDVIDTLKNLDFTARTVVDKQAALATVLDTATKASDVLGDFLANNKERLISVAGSTSKVFGLLDEYSPEFGCVIRGLNTLQGRAAGAIAGGQIHLSAVLDAVPANHGKYVPGEQPRIVTGYGPTCAGLPNPPNPFPIPPKFTCFNDGAALTQAACGQDAKTSGYDQQQVGSATENALVNTLISGSYGTTPDKVPAIATLLAAPALRGAQVSVK